MYYFSDMEFNEWETQMKETFENLRLEHYKIISSQPLHPEMKNKMRNLVDNWIDSAILAQEFRAANHRWAHYLQEVCIISLKSTQRKN